jgi:aerobic carbon-monoxide dehydrogenase medium subunit
MYTFNYHRPASLEEARQLFGEAEDGIYLAGGQTLIPTMKQRLAAPSDVIDLAGINELHGIEVADRAR